MRLPVFAGIVRLVSLNPWPIAEHPEQQHAADQRNRIRTFWHSLILLLILTGTAQATVAYDAKSIASSTAGDPTWTHTPSGTPTGIIIGCFRFNSGADSFTAATYGGAATTKLGAGALATGELGVVALFVTYSPAAGAQQVICDQTDGVSTHEGVAISLTGTNLQTVTFDCTSINSTGVDMPSLTLALGGRTSFAAIFGGSGVNLITGITPFANWTSRDEINESSLYNFLNYTYNTIAATDITAGWDQTATPDEDAVACAVAVSEAVAGTPKGPLIGVLP